MTTLAMTTRPALHHLRTTFNQVVDALPGTQRTMIVMNEAERMTAVEIGTQLGLSRADARVGLLEARLALRQRLTERVRASWQPVVFDDAALRASA